MSLVVFLKQRGVQYGVAGSVIWHLFWMFAISVTFVSPAIDRKATRIHFIGPVLSDDAFNTIVSLKPEVSETFYRSAETLAGETLEPEIGALGHQSPGDIVSVPTGSAAWNLLRGTLGRSGSDTPFDEKLQVRILESPYPITGNLKDRDLFFVPPAPALAAGEAEFELTVDAGGKVASAENIASSGNPETDRAWQSHLKAWQFMPADESAPAKQTGRVRVGVPEGAQP